MAKHIRLVKDGEANGATSISKSFGSVTWGTTSNAQTVNFRSFLTDNNITVELTSGDAEVWRLGTSSNKTGKITNSKDGYTYAIGANKFAYNGTGACNASDASVKGMASGYDFVVYFCPKAATSYSGTITISDGTSTATVTLSGTGIKRNQTIQNFSTTAKTHWTSDAIPAFAAYTTDNTSGEANDLLITYTTSDNQIATVADNGAVTIKKGGNNNDTQVTLRATQAGNDWYNSTYKEVTYTINKVTPVVTWPTIATDLKYNEECAVGDKVSQHWSGGSAKDDKQNPNLTVAGSFTCDDALVPAKNTTGYTAYFTPTNGDWYNSTNMKIYGTVEKADQTLTWNLDESEEYTDGTTFDASATSEMTITYYIDAEHSDIHEGETIADIAEVNENILTVRMANRTITVCAYQAGDDNWMRSDTVCKTFRTCGTKPNNWDDVVAQRITYGQPLAEAKLTGDVKLVTPSNTTVIAGKLTWEDTTIVPKAGHHKEYKVIFTPNNRNQFGSVTFPVAVDVDKATPELVWNIGDVLRGDSKYTNFVVSTNTDPEAVLTISTTGQLSVTGNVLTTNNVSEDATGRITVSLGATTNYNALSQTAVKNVTIKPRVNICLPVTVTDQTLDMIVNSKETYAWYSSSGEINSTYRVALTNFDVRYTQVVGIGLGSWQDGLTGVSWNKIKNLIKGEGEFEWEPKYIDLSFTGVPDSIKFSTALQSVSFDLLGWHTVNPTADTWLVFESVDGNFGSTPIATQDGATSFNVQLQPTTRYVRIEYRGNFTGFIQNLQITRKKEITAEPNSLAFGDATHPLQEPQELTISYSSIGTCQVQSGSIAVSSTNPAFYVDADEITQNVSIDQFGEYTIRVRCNDVNQSGTLTFTASDGTTLDVPVSSATPEITTAANTIFQTGTEHASEPDTRYRTAETFDFSHCFVSGTPLFDTLYIYGVTESAANPRTWVMDANKGYVVPTIDIANNNVHTPCFVYKASGNKYVYERTFNATTQSLNIAAPGKKLGFIGYLPASLSTTNAPIRLTGSDNETTDIYFDNVEAWTNSNALYINSTATADPYTVTLHARGANSLTASAAAVRFSSNPTALRIEDTWVANDVPVSGALSLIPANALPSIDLGSENGSVIINGTQLTLRNAAYIDMAIAYMQDYTPMWNGSVRINDGTILGAAALGMPYNTIIEGGTFNDGTVKAFNRKRKFVRPLNLAGEMLAPTTMAYEDLPALYGKSHLTQDGNAKVHPMLKDESICVFTNAAQDNQSITPSNWNIFPEGTPDAIVNDNMIIPKGAELLLNSLTIAENKTVTISKDAKLIIDYGDSFDREHYGNICVKDGGQLVLRNRGSLSVQDCYLEASLGNKDVTASSGQISNPGMLDMRGDAYFDLVLDPVECSYGWYDFTVPFPVDNRTGISRFQDNEWKNDLRTEQHYAIMTYHEEIRANDQYGWKKYYGVMQPGKCYSITVNHEAPLYRFRKVSDASFVNAASVAMTSTDSGTGGEDNIGWNCIGNGTLTHASFTADHIAKVQVYDHASNSYSVLEGYDREVLPVGTAIFVQVTAATSMIFTEDGSNLYSAPTRTIGRTLSEYLLKFGLEGDATNTDRLYLSASEDALSTYQRGHDLAKFGVSTVVPQIWADAYGQKLCDVEAPLVADQAIIPISLYASQTGTYTLDVVRGPQDASLYLMYNGAVIWNLSQSAYTFDLTRGTNSAYSLLLTAEAPAISTGTDAISGEEMPQVEKILLNGQLYILRDGQMYDATGKKVK